jgi:hypothetical protein
VTIALSTRWIRGGTTPAAAVEALRRLGVTDLFAATADPRWRELRDRGSGFCGVAGSVEGLEDAMRLARSLRAGAIVVEGGAATGGRERAAERLARALHGPLSLGAPIAVTNGAREDDLVGLEEFGWLLEALPRLGLWFDPARAVSRGDALPEAWADRFAGRTTGVVVLHGAARSPDLGILTRLLPRRAPWVLDAGPEVPEADLLLALGSLKASFL